MADNTYPGYGPSAARGGGSKQSGNAVPGDPTNEPGQYPVGSWGDAIFGGPLPSGTGAPGTSGGGGSGNDPTIEAGQLTDGLTGIADSGIIHSGAPGTQGAVVGPDGGGTAVTFTSPSAGYRTYVTETVNDELNGPQDWTQANDDGYATGGPQLPGITGNEPEAGEGRYQPGGSGGVMRGGRMNGKG